MPKVTMFFDETFYQHNGEKSFQISRDIQRLVAEAASTDEVILDPINDVDFIPQPYPVGTLVANPISFEIEMIGYPARKAKLTKEAILHLKKEDHQCPPNRQRCSSFLRKRPAHLAQVCG